MRNVPFISRSAVLGLLAAASGCGAVVPADAGAPADGGAPAADGGASACSVFVACRPGTAFGGGRITTVADDVSRVTTSVDASDRELVAVSDARGTTRVWRATDGGFELLGERLPLVALAAVASLGDTPLVLDRGDASRAPRLYQWSCPDGWTTHSALPLPGDSEPHVFAEGDALLLGATTSSSQAQVFRWVAGAWQPLGGPGLLARLSTMALGRDGQPVAAGLSADGRVTVRRWDGSGWTTLGQLSDVGLWSSEPQVAVTPQGDVVVAWVDRAAVQLARFDGMGWAASAVSGPGAGPLVVRLGLGGDGAPWVAWSEYLVMHDFRVEVARWTGAAWTPVLSALRAGPSGEALVSSLRVVNDSPVVWWRESDVPVGGATQVAARWSSGGCGS